MSSSSTSGNNTVQQISIASLIATAFAFVAALAWNDAIQKSITAAVGEKGSGVGASLLYAGIVTVIAIVVVFVVAKLQVAAQKWKKTLLKPKASRSLDDDGDVDGNDKN